MLEVSGVDHVMTLDLHSSQMQGFFSKPTDNLLAEPCISQFIQDYFEDYATQYAQGCVVCKNAGGAKRCVVFFPLIFVIFFYLFSTGCGEILYDYNYCVFLFSIRIVVLLPWPTV
jgi:ribose-phosphate pyrophosphokinase